MVAPAAGSGLLGDALCTATGAVIVKITLRLAASQHDGPTARIRGLSLNSHLKMIELNPVRQRIADLRGRLDSLRGYL
ncbi:hypothetical protein ASD14_07760 [Lysobacter sp. Root494]|nr:hypothetical protein ASD14_07760 [Lysobacter sp. Root494]